MSVQVKPWQMKDADGNLLSPNTYTNTIYDPDGNNVTGLATEREIGNAYDSSKTYPTYSPYCIHNNKFYKYSGASGTTTTGAWDSTKWTETPIANELSLLNSNLTDLNFGSATEITPSAQGDTWTAPSMGYVSGFFRKNSNATSTSLINISSNKLDGKSKYIATLPSISGAYVPVDMFVVRGEILTFASLLDINLATGQSRLFFNPIIQRT